MDTPFKYRISVIIVNYNVSYFLDQCLDSVLKSAKGLDVEIIVVDNNSKDNSLEMVRKLYPEVILIANTENVGFSKANNQGIAIAKGEWILLLNPDTVVGEKTFSACLEFVASKKDCGALGIRMINGRGEFLPESKRGLPTPSVAFYKLSGLSKLFPRSKRFNKYHAGHIAETENSEVDILSGAFMLLKREALDKSGLLDETFFMYGEDIDLSYRIQLAGYKNYYFSETPIIHYKGESTKKSSVNYVFVFYRAMVIFAKKHFGKKNAGLFNFIINLGIYARASFAIAARLVKKTLPPLMDIGILTAGMFALSNYWQMRGIAFPETAFNILIPIYAFVWVVSLLINGAYDKISLFKLFKSGVLGTVFILIVYALLPKDWQFSRLFILTGMLWLFVYYAVSRLYFLLLGGYRLQLSSHKRKNFLIVGNAEEVEDARLLLEQTQALIGTIQVANSVPSERDLNKFDELIFCSKSSTFSSIIDEMINLRGSELEFKIAPSGRDYLIGSNSIDTAGDLYFLELNALVNSENSRKKRVFDVTVSSLILLTSPILIYFFKNKRNLLKNCWDILRNRRTFIGFNEEDFQRDHRLPKTLPGILSPSDEISIHSEELSEKLNLLYARDYSIAKDLRILFRAWKKLDSI